MATLLSPNISASISFIENFERIAPNNVWKNLERVNYVLAILGFAITSTCNARVAVQPNGILDRAYVINATSRFRTKSVRAVATVTPNDCADMPHPAKFAFQPRITVHDFEYGVECPLVTSCTILKNEVDEWGNLIQSHPCLE